MRWLKHLTAAHRDEKLAAFIDEFGLEGYGFWWLLLEVVGHVVKGDQCEVTYSLAQWSRLLGCHHHKVTKYLNALSSTGGVTPSVTTPGTEGGSSGGNRGGSARVTGLVEAEFIEGKVRVRIPNLLKYRDEYARKSGQTSVETPDSSPDNVVPRNRSRIQKQKLEKKKTPSESKKKSAKDLVEGFVVLPKHREWASKKCPSVPVDEEVEAWKDRMRSSDYRYGKANTPVADAQASFYTSCRNAEAWGTYRKGVLFNSPHVIRQAPRKTE